MLEQRISIVTLGVGDLSTSEGFYSGVLGWEPVRPRDEGIVFYQLGGIQLALYPIEKFVDEFDDGQGSREPGRTNFTLAYNVNSREEVDEVFAGLERAGVRIVKLPEEVFWGGYSGYFADPDGHMWEVAFNPFTLVDSSGAFGAARK